MEELSCSCVGRERNGGARVNELSPDSPQEPQDVLNTRGAPAGHIATAGTSRVLQMDGSTATMTEMKNHHARAMQGGLNLISN